MLTFQLLLPVSFGQYSLYDWGQLKSSVCMPKPIFTTDLNLLLSESLT